MPRGQSLPRRRRRHPPAVCPDECFWNLRGRKELKNRCCPTLGDLRWELALAIRRLRRKPHLYWSTAWAEAQLRRVLVEHRAAMGYSTAFWRFIRDAHPLYERDGWHAGLQRQARWAYPEELRRTIIALNHPYLRDHPFSYRQQAAKALERHDRISVNHRVAAYLASYFDIVFALNRGLHPGEKRLLEHVMRECPLRPAEVISAVERLVGLAGQAVSSLLDTMDALTMDLEVLLHREQVLPDE